MRSFLPFILPLTSLSAALAMGCSSNTGSGFGDAGTGQSSSSATFSCISCTSTGTGTGTGHTTTTLVTEDAGTSTGSSGVTVTTIYADTDTALYTLDPATNAVTMIGAFTGFSGATGDDGATDLAVNAEGEVYINSESVIYKATLPAGGTGTVALTQIAKIALKSNSFYALAFAPANVLGMGETLVGGDNNGELWSIDPTTGATKDLGNFGPNPSDSSDILGLSGDIVFYVNSAGAATGLATIRSCSKSGNCTTKDDYLAGIDMQALQTAYTSGTPATSLLGGVYGGGSNSVGAGTNFAELFGLGAWQGTVFGFGHSTGDLITINTSGVGSLVTTISGTEWAGAGVSTKTTITVAPPPPSAK